MTRRKTDEEILADEEMPTLLQRRISARLEAMQLYLAGDVKGALARLLRK